MSEAKQTKDWDSSSSSSSPPPGILGLGWWDGSNQRARPKPAHRNRTPSTEKELGMRKPHTAPDWARMIEDIVETGLNYRQIGDATGTVMTPNMIRHYQLGVQPLYWRGEAMVVLWMKATGKERSALPTQEVTAPYRVPQGAKAPEVVVNLPNWPPASVASKPTPQPSVKPLGGKRKQRGMVTV